MRRRLLVTLTTAASLLVPSGLSIGIAHAESLPSGELTCAQLFSKFERDQQRLEVQEQKAQKTQQNIRELGDLVANAQSKNARSFFLSQLEQQLSLFQSREQNVAQGQLVVAQDQALLTQQGCNTA